MYYFIFFVTAFNILPVGAWLGEIESSMREYSYSMAFDLYEFLYFDLSILIFDLPILHLLLIKLL